MRARHTVLDTCTTVQLEGAFSRYDRNINADSPTVNGGAGGIRLRRVTERGEVGAAFSYVGGGFVTLANSELASDRVEGRVHGRRELVPGRLRIGGTAELRRDDISGTLGGKTTRQSYGAQVGWQPVLAFGTDVDVTYLSARSPGGELRGALEERTIAITACPRANWNWLGLPQSISSSISFQKTDNSDSTLASFADSRNTTVALGWQGGLSKLLFVNLTGNYVKSRIGAITSEVSSAGPGIGLTLLKGRAQTSVQLQMTQTRLTGLGTDRDLAPSVDLRYLVTGHQMLVLRAGVRRFRTGTIANGDFEERLATLQYSATL
jgi:hypothetical protein